MAHSVQSHLSVSPADYDAGIVRFVPFYDEMIACAVDWLARLAAPGARVLDLGAGTGALSQRVAARLPHASLTLLDADPAMLEQARARLGAGPALQRGSFFDPLPACDAAIASLSLHHVTDLAQKRALYSNIRRALPPGAPFVNADATVPANAALSKAIFGAWAAHLVAHGDSEAQAFARFRAWAEEDTYFSVEDELDALRAAGFRGADVVWRSAPATVLIAVA